MPDAGGGKHFIGGNISFLSGKEFDGKLKTAEGTLSGIGDLATLTAATGKDMYLAKAKVSVRMEGTATFALTVVVELKVNGVIKATYGFDGGMGTGGGQSSDNYEFAVSGLKVLAGQIIKLEATTVDINIAVRGELVCYEEDTGVDPRF